MKFRVNDLVWIPSQKQKGKIKAITRTVPPVYKVEVIVNFDKETGERTTKLIEVKGENLKPYRKQRTRTRRKFKNIWAKVHPDAKIPTKRREDAGYDIYACFDEDELILKKLQPNFVPTGIASALPPSFYWNVKHERGLTGKYGMLLLSGCIDSGYRGEWFINICPLYKDVVISKTYQFPIENGKKKPVELEDKIMYPYDLAIAQAVKLPVYDDENIEIPYKELLKIKSERGTGKLGDSGK